MRKVRAETSEIRSFELEPMPGESLPPFEAGAHIDVFPLPGLGRQYSLVNAPDDGGRYLIGVKRELNGRGGSTAMHSQLREGCTVRIGHPRNNFALRQSGGRSILLAGGIGVTPLLSMAQSLSAKGAEIASPRAGGDASGIVAFRLPDEAPGRTAARLRAAGVFVVERRGCVRASPHFYNSTDDLDRLLRAL